MKVYYKYVISAYYTIVLRIELDIASKALETPFLPSYCAFAPILHPLQCNQL
jgi:hypothetical protein